ncbi:MAG: 3-oxoacyl-ACP reductase FabG [Oscillospiraceae bacterium]|nr:3-oxoacyl-ACP reductase FabG [Oscillospiraceae bacterium]
MKTALVTGASRGIGAAIAFELARAGYAVAVNYATNKDAAESVIEKISKNGGVAKGYKADISNAGEVTRLFEDVSAELGEIEVLVNNAGVAHIGLLQDMTDSEIERLVGVDLLGAIYCSKEAVKRMVKLHKGVIINISSMWGEVGASCEAVYSTCKAGVIGLTKALAKEVGPSGIRVNCVSPGVIATDMNAELDDETMQSLCEETPLLRIGSANDVASTVAFLASDEASFITGQVLSVNGGII